MMKKIKSATIIGSGNVASWFAYILHHNGFKIVEIFSRKKDCSLANRYGATPIHRIVDLSPKSDIYIFSLKDDTYLEILSQFPFHIPLAVHTSGSLSMHIFNPYAQSYGVLYPYQTISKNLDFQTLEVPLCVEGDNVETKELLLSLAQKLSKKVEYVEEKERQALHLAAVFASNFSNALYGIAYDILDQANLDWSLMMPLLEQTLKKTAQMSPIQAQTGPAKRGDSNIMQFHLEQIQDEKWKAIYNLLSQYIYLKEKELKK